MGLNPVHGWMVDLLDLTALSMERGMCLGVFCAKCQGKLRDGMVVMKRMGHGCQGAAGQGWHMIAVGSLCRSPPQAFSSSVLSYFTDEVPTCLQSPKLLYIKQPGQYVMQHME